MSVILLRLAGPLQSWGVESKFETRRTLNFPTKSGVIGLLASALGYSRDKSPESLTAMKFGVRADCEGEMLSDYHIARGKKDKDVYITQRYYLSDAVFLAGFESPDSEFLLELEYALKNPAFPLFLGRRSCVPTMPLFLGIRNDSLLNVLRNEQWLVPEWRRKKIPREKLRIVIDSEVPDLSSLINDLPVSFSKKHRKFGLRSVRQEYISVMSEELG